MLTDSDVTKNLQHWNPTGWISVYPYMFFFFINNTITKFIIITHKIAVILIAVIVVVLVVPMRVGMGLNILFLIKRETWNL